VPWWPRRARVGWEIREGGLGGLTKVKTAPLGSPSRN